MNVCLLTHFLLKGVLVGQSTGAYLIAVEIVAKDNPKGVLVTLGCDTGERYFSTQLWGNSSFLLNNRTDHKKRSTMKKLASNELLPEI